MPTASITIMAVYGVVLRCNLRSLYFVCSWI